MLRVIKHNHYNRDILIGRPNLTLKNFKCQNITCGKHDKFKKYKEHYICECGYIAIGDFEVEEVHKVKFYCTSPKNCPDSKTKMDKSCLKCSCIGER